MTYRDTVRLILAALTLAASIVAAVSSADHRPMMLERDGSGIYRGEPFCLEHRAAACRPPTELQPQGALALFRGLYPAAD